MHCVSFVLQVGAVQVPVVALQSGALAHRVPMLSQPLRFALQTCGWAPLQRICPEAHVGIVHVPLAATQSGAEAHSVPWLTQPLRFGLQTSG